MIETKDRQLDALAILNAIPGCYLVLLPDTPRFTIVAATDAYLDITRTSREELIGLGVFEAFSSNTDEKGKASLSNLRTSLNYVLEQKNEDRMPRQSYDMVSPATGHQEERVWNSINKPVLNIEGKILYIIHWVENITGKLELEASEKAALRALEDSEMNLKNIVMHAPVAMAILRGPNYEVEIVNDKVLEIWDKTKQEVIGRPIFEVLPEAKYQGFEELLDNVYATGNTSAVFEKPAQLTHTGALRTFYLNFVYQALKDTNGVITGILIIAHDVTDQVLSRGIVKESREELGMAVDIANLGTFRVDLNDYMGTYSNRVKEWFGIREDRLPMDVIFSYIHKQDRANVQKIINETLVSEKQSRHDVTYRVVHPSTHVERHLRSFGKTLFNDDGKPYAIIGIIQDVTRQMVYQADLERSEIDLQQKVKERTSEIEQQKKFISSILDASFNGIYSLEAIRNPGGEITDFRYLFVNEHISKNLRLSPAEVVGKHLLELLPETRESGFFDLFVSVLEKGKPVREETWFDSHIFKGWFDYTIVPIDKDILVVTVQDITDQKNAMLEVERQKNMLDKIMQHSPSGITVTEVIRNKEGEIIDGKTILANAISGQFLGISHQQLLSKTSSEIDPNILDSPVFNQALHTLATGEPFITQYFLQPTGRWMELAVAKMDEDHLINVFTDVTEVRQSQLQMEKYVEELKRSNANLEEFAYAASHDLKEPVRKINFFGDRLKAKLKGKMDEEDLHYFNRMEFAAKRMTSLIDDLLVYSHVSRGAVLEERINLNKKVEMVLGDLELLVQEKNAVVDVGPLPIIIGHRRQIQQLFQNLISNALKYSKPDVPPRITIRSQDVRGQDVPIQLPGKDASKRFHLIEVRDNGIGFEQDEAERIFKVFTRLHSSAEYRGTGIGLSIARRVVENHNGYIWAESKPGEGSVFRILLPVNAV